MPEDWAEDLGPGPASPRAQVLSAVQRHPNILAAAAIAGMAVLPLLLVPMLWGKGPVVSVTRTERVPRPSLTLAEGRSPEFMDVQDHDSAPQAMTSIERNPLEAAGPEAPRMASRRGAATASPAGQARAAPARPPRHLAAHASAARRAARAHGRPQVVIRRRAGSEPAADAAREVAAATRRAGFKVAGTHSDPLVTVSRFVRYYHRADAAAAERLARRLGSEWQTQDFRAFPRPGRAGVLELWLPDR